MSHRHERDDVFAWPRLYDWADRVCTFGGHARLCARAAELLAEYAPRRVIDVGSGTGALSIALRRRYPTAEIIGVEPGARMVAWARRKATRAGLDIAFRQGYGQRLPVADGVVDAVTISLVLHHVADADVPDVLGEALRVLRPGGVLLVVEIAPAGPIARLPPLRSHAQPLTEYAARIRLAGFVDVRAARLTPRLTGYVRALAPSVTDGGDRMPASSDDGPAG